MENWSKRGKCLKFKRKKNFEKNGKIQQKKIYKKVII